MEKLITTQHWYMKDVFRWRTGASMVWSLILLPFIAAVYTLLIKISIFHPYQWIVDWLVTTISFSGVVYIVLIAVLNLLVAIGNLLCYTETLTSWYIPKEPNRPYQRPWVVSPINPISVADSVFGPTLGTPQVLGQDLLHDTVFADSMTENTRCDALGTSAAPLNRPLLHGEQRKSSAADCFQWASFPWQYRLDFLRTWHLGARLLDPFQESQSRALFADAQLHIWALEAVTSLVVSSYHEDTYGVVQGTLADVLISMLDLQNAVEKHFKLPTSLPRWGPKDIRLVRSGPLHPDDKLRFDLKSTVKTSLQRIIKVFGPHLNNVQLGPIYKQKLALLMELK